MSQDVVTPTVLSMFDGSCKGVWDGNGHTGTLTISDQSSIRTFAERTGIVSDDVEKIVVDCGDGDLGEKCRDYLLLTDALKGTTASEPNLDSALMAHCFVWHHGNRHQLPDGLDVTKIRVLSLSTE